MIRRLAAIVVFGAVLAATLPGCLEDDLESIIYYNFELLEPPPRDFHYQQFAQISGGVVDLGCFVVEMRQVQCTDFTAEDPPQPRLRPAVVECSECPCIDRAFDPCVVEPNPPRIVTLGEIRGTVDHPDGVLRSGGVEYPTRVALADADELFITIEPDFGDEPEPSGDIILLGEAVRDGTVLRGILENPQGGLVKGLFTIVPLKDEVKL